MGWRTYGQTSREPERTNLRQPDLFCEIFVNAGIQIGWRFFISFKACEHKDHKYPIRFASHLLINDDFEALASSEQSCLRL